MAKFAKNAAPTEERYSIGLNVILAGSKKMTEPEIEALLSTGEVRVVISDAADEERVLVDEVVAAKQFSTGSVGFGLNKPGLQFSQS